MRYFLCNPSHCLRWISHIRYIMHSRKLHQLPWIGDFYPFMFTDLSLEPPSNQALQNFSPSYRPQDPQSSEEKVFKCLSCQKSFKTKNSVKIHYQNVHERVNRVNCAKCGRFFSNKYILKKHCKKQHPPTAEIY